MSDPRPLDLEKQALARFAAALRSAPGGEAVELSPQEFDRLRATLERLGVDPETYTRRLFPPPEDRRGSPRLADEVLELLAEAGVDEVELAELDPLAPPPAASDEELEQQVLQAVRSALAGVERPRKF